jgi:hypothetical protein
MRLLALDRAAAKFLFQRSIDQHELAVQLGAHAVDDGNDGECDAGSDQSIFDRSSACDNALMIFIRRPEAPHW